MDEETIKDKAHLDGFLDGIYYALLVLRVSKTIEDAKEKMEKDVEMALKLYDTKG